MTDTSGQPDSTYPDETHEDLLRIAREARREEVERQVDRELTDRAAERDAGDVLMIGLFLGLAKHALATIREDSLRSESLAQWKEQGVGRTGVQLAVWGLPLIGSPVALKEEHGELLTLARLAWGIGFVIERDSGSTDGLVDPVPDLIAIISLHYSNLTKRHLAASNLSRLHRGRNVDTARRHSFASTVVSQELHVAIDLADVIESVQRGQPEAVPPELRSLLNNFTRRIDIRRTAAVVGSSFLVVGGLVGGALGYTLAAGFSSTAEKYYRAKARLADRPGQP